jgi:hypothetical protein
MRASASPAVAGTISHEWISPAMRMPSGSRMLLKRMAHSFEVWSMTKVPRPCRREIRRSLSISSSALRTVPTLMPSSRDSSISLAIAAPGFHAPATMRCTSMSLTCR